jgi:hypothetical protein
MPAQQITIPQKNDRFATEQLAWNVEAREGHFGCDVEVRSVFGNLSMV